MQSAALAGGRWRREPNFALGPVWHRESLRAGTPARRGRGREVRGAIARSNNQLTEPPRLKYANPVRVAVRFFSGVPHPHLLGVCCPNIPSSST